MKIIRDDVRYLLFINIYRRFQEPKTNRKAYAILESAIVCYAKKGWAKTTLEMIARESGVSRTLILHYFKDSKDLRDVTIQYVRLLLQKYVVDAISQKKNPAEMLETYIRTCFLWTEHMRSHALLWFSFLFACCNSPKDRKLNTEAVTVGCERLASIIAMGMSNGVFKVVDPLQTAQALQAFIAGGMISYASQDFSNDSRKAYLEMMTEHCFRFVKP